MAKKVYIDFELRYKEAVANLDEMQKEYTKLEKKVEKYDDAVQESSESAKEMGGVLDSVTGGAITKFKGLTSTVGNVIKGFNILEYKPKLVSIEIHDRECPPLKNKIYKYFINNKYNLVSIYGWTYFFEFKKNSKVHFKI